MKRIVFSALLLLFTLGAASQRPEYDPSKEVVLKGGIVYAGEYAAAVGKGFYVIMKDEPNEIEVYLAPGDVIKRSGFHFATGDPVEITGSRVKCPGTEVVLARKVVHEGKTLTLRNEKGDPVW